MLTDAQILERKAFEGLKKRGFYENKEYYARLKYELEVIISLGFESYFLIMQDIILWAMDNMTVGPARGSVSASLLSYCLYITQVDPIKHDLMFERFLNPARGSLIDIQSITDKLSQQYTKEDMNTDVLSACIKDRTNEDIIENIKEEERQLRMKGSEFIGQLIASQREGIKLENTLNSWALYCMGISDEQPNGKLRRSHGSPPDIDSDFSDRDAVYEYVKNKYGEEHVAKVGSWGLLKTKSAIRDVCRILDKPIALADEIAKLVPPPRHGIWISFEDDCLSSPELLNPKYKEVTDNVRQMCGLLRNYGTHAGGVVISPIPVNTIVPLYKDKEGNSVTQFDHRNIEDIGLLKFDFLGLSTLSIIEETQRLLKRKHVEIDLFSLKDGDKKAYELINSGNLDGVFQLCDSAAPITLSFQPKSIEDISHISAVNRPGPISSGLLNILLARRSGKEAVAYLHPSLEPILADTYGVVLYQEQVIKIFTELAGYSAAAAENMRKVIGKKKLGELEKNRARFIKGCKENEINEHVAEELFKNIENSASYLFNKGHSVAYSYISYFCAYLKAHYPEEFYCALLTCEKDPDQKIRFASSMKSMGITMLPPDVNASDINYTPVNKGVRFGLGHIKGAASKKIAAIIEERNENGLFKSIEDLTQRVAIDLKTATAIGLSGALSSIETELNEKECAQYICDWVTYWRNWNKATYKEKQIEKRELENEKRKAAGKTLLKPLREPTFPKLPAIPKVTYSGREAIALQRDILSMYISGHPLDEVPENNSVMKIKDLWMCQEFDPCIIRGVLLSVKTMTTKKKEMMAIFRVEDRTKSIEVLLFPRQYPQYKDLLVEGNILEISGKIKKQQSFSDDEFGSESDIVKIFASNIGQVVLPSERKNWAIVCPLLKGKMKIEGGNNVSKTFIDSVLGLNIN